ncbi:helix-turn-helix transcriptional regulator [Myroides sp. LJL116]
MARKESIKRHFIIIDLLSKRSMSFEQIKEQLFRYEESLDYHYDISQRTFRRDCLEIEELWGVQIKYNNRSLQYEIIDNHQDSHLERLLESYTIMSALRNKDRIGKHLFLENRKSSGQNFFKGIFDAIENNSIITFDHTSYWKQPSFRTCVPKAIKESQNRFYLLAYDLDKKDFRNFGLDRIANLTIKEEKKQTPAIDVENYYQHSFGIETYGEPTKVILEFANEQKNYVKSLPLHKSQKIICESQHTFTVELFIHPTNDFLLEIMKNGPNCQIIEPISLREEAKQKALALYRMYYPNEKHL